MTQLAVVLKDQLWTVFKEGAPVTSGLSRSAAIELAESLAFQAEDRGEEVELLIQDYTGAVQRRLSGGLSSL
jgi:hypothetical protein